MRHVTSAPTSATPRKRPRATATATFTTKPSTPTAASNRIMINNRSNPMATFRHVQCTPARTKAGHDDLDRDQRMAVPPLEGHVLSGRTAPAGVAPVLHDPVPGGRGQ